MSEIEVDPLFLKPCDNSLCDRRTTRGVLYCCAPCDQAHKGGYEIHESGPLAHTATCDERYRVREGADPGVR